MSAVIHKSVPEVYFKVGGAFDSDTTQLKIGYTGFSLFNQVSNNTGFRCVANLDIPSSVSYSHLTLPTKAKVKISVVAVS